MNNFKHVVAASFFLFTSVNIYSTMPRNPRERDFPYRHSHRYTPPPIPKKLLKNAFSTRDYEHPIIINNLSSTTAKNYSVHTLNYQGYGSIRYNKDGRFYAIETALVFSCTMVDPVLGVAAATAAATAAIIEDGKLVQAEKNTKNRVFITNNSQHTVTVYQLIFDDNKWQEQAVKSLKPNKICFAISCQPGVFYTLKVNTAKKRINKNGKIVNAGNHIRLIRKN